MEDTFNATTGKKQALIDAELCGSPVLSDEEALAYEVRQPAPNAEHDGRAIAARFGIIAPALSRLFDLGVEARGVERIPEDQRSNKYFWNNILMWWSVNSSITTLSVGILSRQTFHLTLPHAIASILFFGAIATTMTASVAILGPRTGLRTMIIARFSSGYIGGIMFSLFNILTILGFATSCVIFGGQTLAEVNPGTLPLPAGIAIIAVLSLIPCFIGYEAIHRYEKYAWIVLTALMLCLWGLAAHAGFDVVMEKLEEDTGQNRVADVLSFAGVIFAAFSSWAPVIADYNCRMPADMPPRTIFAMSFVGIYIPICAVEILGAALTSVNAPAYRDALNNHGFGALLAQVVAPWNGGGKFLLLLFALSVLTNNIVNTYSAGLSIQSLGRPFARLPRAFWTVIVCGIYTAAGIAGRDHFAAFLANFLSILGYWTALFIVVVMEEHFLFRRQGGRLGGYNLDDWDRPSRLPTGIAGVLAACFGGAGAVVGMSEVWYTGPIGKLARGSDLGFELAAVFAAITYPPLRWLEIYFTGR